MEQHKLLLNQSRFIESDKSNTTIPIQINGDKEVIVEDRFNDEVNLYNVYLDEREACTTIRLTSKVNLVATNVLFNSVTEIVKNEGGDDCECLNYNDDGISIPTTIGKESGYKWHYNNNWGGIYDCIMDTQISYSGDKYKNYTYLCGIDIFANHIMRSKTKYPSFVVKSANGQDEVCNFFNTLSECACDYTGFKSSKWSYITSSPSECGWDTLKGEERQLIYERKYNKTNIYSFAESLQKNMLNRNGWVGFINKSQMVADFVNSGLCPGYNTTGCERVINNRFNNSYVDLFPDRTRFTLQPHYNKYRNREEKNWEWCLTYPSGHTSAGFTFIDDNLKTLRVAFIDENESDDDDVYRCTFYSVSKHGLKEGDTINLYRSRDDGSESEKLYSELVVDTVVDDYVFKVYTPEWICDKWVSVFDTEQLEELGITHIEGNEFLMGDTHLYSFNNYINADFDTEEHIGSQNLSFARTVDGIQSKYYVRVFSRFPNFDFYDKEVTEDNIYTEKDGVLPIEKYSNLEYEKQNTLTRLGFSKNIYGDQVHQIVFNDDINIDVIKDNLGRPLTSLYLTFFKTNYGYKEWYALKDVGNPNVEWSRCFGKLNCGFELSPYLVGNKFTNGDIHTMSPLNGVSGLYQKRFWNDVDDGESDDTVLYKNQNKFYGDLCEYSPIECQEIHIQDSFYRFNTAQREIGGYGTDFVDTKKRFSSVFYEEIKHDTTLPWQSGGNFATSQFITDKLLYDKDGSSKPEGYYYKANYEVPIRTFSEKVFEFNPEFFDLTNIQKVETSDVDKEIFILTTPNETYFDMNSDVYVYNTQNFKSIRCELLNVLDLNKIQVKLPISEVPGSFNDANIASYKVYKRTTTIPSYAEIGVGNNSSYRWREIVQNGFEETAGLIQEYPFVNGCLYVNTDINIFLRRQDPFGDYGMAMACPYFGLPSVTGERNPIEDGTAKNINDAINERDIKC
jgi:hypothetical protein